MHSFLWILDFRAFHHMSPDLSSFTTLSNKCSGSAKTVNGTPMRLVVISFIVTPHLSFSSVYHILNLSLNLDPVDQLCDFGSSISFSSTSYHVEDPQSQKLIKIGDMQGDYMFWMR